MVLKRQWVWLHMLEIGTGRRTSTDLSLNTYESLNLELQTKGATRSGSSCADLMSQSTRCAFRALVPWSWSLMFKFRVRFWGWNLANTASTHLVYICQ